VRLSWAACAFLAIWLVGAFLLFYRLPAVPPEMQSDHAEKLLDVRDVLDGQHRIFFPRNTGREAFQFYWAALLSPLTGVSYLGLKIGTALLALATFPFVFLFARTVGGTALALLTTALLATSRWHLIVGRRGLRFPFPPLFGSAIGFFLFRALRDRRRNDFLLCGLALGIGQHTYIPLRIAPFVVAACLLAALVADVRRLVPPGRVHRLVVDSALLFAVSALVFMPLGRYAADNPSLFLFRGLSRISGDPGEVPPPAPLAVLADNVKNALLMFNWRGDNAWVNNIPGAPMLDAVSAALFVLGCAYALYRLLRHGALVYGYLLLYLFGGLWPSILSIAFPLENPATARMGMALPPTMILVALPLLVLGRRLEGTFGQRAGRAAAGVGLVLVLGAVVRLNVRDYFDVYPRQYFLASQHVEGMAQTIKGFVALGGQLQDVHILPAAFWVDTRSVASEVGDVRWNPSLGGAGVEAARLQDGLPRERLYIVHPDDRAAIDALTRWYPTADRQTHTLPAPAPPGTPYFVTFLIPAGAVAAD
jgi:hypothetical protein